MAPIRSRPRILDDIAIGLFVAGILGVFAIEFIPAADNAVAGWITVVAWIGGWILLGIARERYRDTHEEHDAATEAIIRIFLQDINAERFITDLMKATGLPSGTVYPILTRLEQAGWLMCGYERLDAAQARPARRYYKPDLAAVADLRARYRDTRDEEGDQ